MIYLACMYFSGLIINNNLVVIIEIHTHTNMYSQNYCPILAFQVQCSIVVKHCKPNLTHECAVIHVFLCFCVSHVGKSLIGNHTTYGELPCMCNVIIYSDQPTFCQPFISGIQNIKDRPQASPKSDSAFSSCGLIGLNSSIYSRKGEVFTS